MQSTFLRNNGQHAPFLHISVLCLWILALGCGDDSNNGGGGESGGGSGQGGSGGQPRQDGGDVEDATADSEAAPAEGPWECVFPNTAVHKERGWTEECGFDKCRAGTGCKQKTLGRCETDDDCISSTLERGWEGDRPVFCDSSFLCSPDPLWTYLDDEPYP